MGRDTKSRRAAVSTLCEQWIVFLDAALHGNEMAKSLNILLNSCTAQRMGMFRAMN